MAELEVVGMTTVEERLRRAARTHRILGNHTAEGLYLEAADTICRLQAEKDKLRDKGHAYAYEAGYSDGSTHYELEHCPACKNVADLQEALDENAKLRELVRDMWFWSYEGHIDSEPQEKQMKHIDGVLNRMRELRVEVE
jgi:hypothetical protein